MPAQTHVTTVENLSNSGLQAVSTVGCKMFKTLACCLATFGFWFLHAVAAYGGNVPFLVPRQILPIKNALAQFRMPSTFIQIHIRPCNTTGVTSRCVRHIVPLTGHHHLGRFTTHSNAPRTVLMTGALAVERHLEVPATATGQVFGLLFWHVGCFPIGPSGARDGGGCELVGPTPSQQVPRRVYW
jgi:hypothetical protein